MNFFEKHVIDQYQDVCSSSRAKAQLLSTSVLNCRHISCANNNFNFKSKKPPYKNISNSSLNTLNTCLKWKRNHFIEDSYDSGNMKRPLLLNDYDKDMILHTCCEIL